MNKKKIVNDPVYGFITIPNELIYDIIQHPYFQRLRRIKQLGLTEYVYPGALHTRFQHALGAMHLMTKALDTLRQKGHLILDAEYEAAQIAILLHDIGHGPFSHTLEFSLFDGVDHEKITGWTL
ncbi:MAG: HD superfamily phosphohydrolase, partial [Cyclobacteriaceae bacterium]